jgi:5-methylcytosine-specific restriction enzyme subunit McrC
VRTEVLTESTPRRVRLSQEQAKALEAAGVRLAGDATWWGQGDDEPVRSVIECAPAPDGDWIVRVADAIGVVVVGDVQLVVEPKIPLAHLLYLLEAGDYIPRVIEELGAVEGGQSLWRLVARWFVGAAEGVLRRDLLRDYHPEAGELTAARGQVVALATARAYYAGRLRFECRYEEFGQDTPLNRVLKRAAQIVAASPLLDAPLRARSVRILARMDEVGPIEPRDTNVRPERNSSYYKVGHAM